MPIGILHDQIFPGGQFGVNIFFILSGFLITLLLLEEEKWASTVSLKKFYFRRVIRIFPIYYIMLLTYYCLQAAGVLHFTTNSWLSTISYSKDVPVPHSYSWETDHLWSLSVEEHFYLAWPLVFKFLKRYRVKIAFAVVILIPIVRGIVYGLNENDEGTNIYERADALMWGCLLAIYYQQVWKIILTFIKRYKFSIAIPFAGLLFSLTLVKIFHPESAFAEGLIRALGRADGTATDIFICVIIVIAINVKNNRLYTYLNSNLMNYVGKISYSLYIWQELFFSYHIGVFGIFPFNIICIAIVAVVSYHFIEKPFLLLKSRFEVKRSSVLPDMQSQGEQEQVEFINSRLALTPFIVDSTIKQ